MLGDEVEESGVLLRLIILGDNSYGTIMNSRTRSIGTGLSLEQLQQAILREVGLNRGQLATTFGPIAHLGRVNNM